MITEEQSGFKKMIKSTAFKGASIAVVSMALSAGVTYLATTSGSSADSAIATLKGDKITVSDFYNEAKYTSSSQQSMLTLILTKVFEEQYGDKVSDDDVNAAYEETASSYGESFSAALSSAGLIEETYKQQIRTSKLVEYAVEQAAKKKLTTDNYKSAYESYNADTTAQVIAVSSEDTANSVLEQVTAEGADFSSIATANTTLSQVEYTFDSADTDLPDEVMEAAFSQDEGAVSSVVKVLNTSTYSYTYYIVKTTAKTEKDSNWKTYKKRLKKIIIEQYKSDSDFQNQVISEALDKANVKIKDDAFADILAQYVTSSSSSSSSTSTSSSSSDSSDSSTSTDEAATTEDSE